MKVHGNKQQLLNHDRLSLVGRQRLYFNKINCKQFLTLILNRTIRNCNYMMQIQINYFETQVHHLKKEKKK
jgi:hypothetical protein